MKKSALAQIIVFIFAFAFLSTPRLLTQALAPTMRAHGLSPSLVFWATALLCAWFVLSFMKRMMLRSIPDDFVLEPMDPASLQWLDQQTLASLTAELESLYFVRAGDVTLKTKAAVIPAGFARILVHPTLHCYAEINQLATASVPMACVIVTKFSDDWSLSTHTRFPRSSSWVLRRPRSVWTAHPFMATADLLQAHLAWRENMLHDLGVDVISDMSLETYEAHERSGLKLSKSIMKRKPMLISLIEMTLFSWNPKYQWLGDYARVAKKRGLL